MTAGHTRATLVPMSNDTKITDGPVITPPPTRIVFLDTETTGLRPHNGHRPWEVAWIVCEIVDPFGRAPYLRILERHQHFFTLTKSEMHLADPVALNIGHYSRCDPSANEFANDIQCVVQLHHDLYKAFIAGAVIDFDCRMLQHLFAKTNIFAFDDANPLYDPARPWHYHIIDTEVLAAGHLHELPPYSSSKLSRTLGIPDSTNRHEAMVDAQWALDMFVAAYGLAVQDTTRPVSPPQQPDHIFEPYAANPGICRHCGAVKPFPCYAGSQGANA